VTAVRRLLNDLRVLGRAAPVRAAYEASKRSGFHTVLFRSAWPPERTSARPPRLGNAERPGPAAARRCLDDARLILDEGVRIFGQRVRVGADTQWNTDPLTGRSWPSDQPWWRIDIRSPARLSDVKFVWEAGRHRDLVVLARADRLDPSGPWSAALVERLRAWCRDCPPERGVHWGSSLELALRAIAWSQVLRLGGRRLPADLCAMMERHLLASARHLLLELPYTLSSMRNNHLLGDALGLIVLGRMFPAAGSADRWVRTGERMFTAQLARHMRDDGSMIEDSLSYHRFVLEMLCVRVMLGGARPDVRVALNRAARYLADLGVFDGEVPQFGDWDEGRVLASSGDPLTVAGSAALGLVLSGERVPAGWYDEYDELAWYAPTAASTPDGPGTRPAAAVAAGAIARADRGPWRVWFKVGGGPSHGHADLTSVWIAHDGAWLVSDPGTGTYNGPLAVRNALRTSGAHPVQRPDGRDQLGPHRAFRWLRTARGHLAPPLALADRTVLFGWHDAYRRLDPGLRVGRAVVVGDDHVVILEYVDDPGAARSWSMTVPLHPDVDLKDGHAVVGGCAVPLVGLDPRAAVRGRVEPFAGWHSRTYGQWEPATWLAVRRDRPAPWGFGTPRCRADEPRVVDGFAYDVRWEPDAATLTAVDTMTGDRFELRAAS
jgi:hypothetical protein